MFSEETVPYQPFLNAHTFASGLYKMFFFWPLELVSYHDRGLEFLEWTNEYGFIWFRVATEIVDYHHRCLAFGDECCGTILESVVCE